MINEYFPNTNALISQLMYQNPEITAEATRPEADELSLKFLQTFPDAQNPQFNIKPADVVKSALQYAFNRMDAITENRLALFDMLYAGYCAVEVNHINRKALERTDMMSEQSNADNMADMQAKPSGIIDKVTTALGSMFNNDQTQTSQTNQQVEEQLDSETPPKEYGYSTTDETYIKRWNPMDILLDWRAERIKDMRYTIKKIRISQAEFNVRYPQYKDIVRPGDDQLTYAKHEKAYEKNTILLYEIQVKKNGDKYCNFVISKSYLRSEIDYWERPFTTNTFDLKIGTLHEYGKLYPVSFARLNKTLQDDLNNYATFKMEVAERNVPKRGYNVNKVKAEGVIALNSSKVNEAVPVDGTNENIWTIQGTQVSQDNNEMIPFMMKTKEKLWNISESKLGGESNSELATEMNIQEAGFQNRTMDLQTGLRKLLKVELDALKDIIVQFWDDQYFFKVTGSGKPLWYKPQVDPMDGQTVLNPLTDLLTGDYEVDVDVTSSLKPNKEKKKADVIQFAEFMVAPPTVQFAMMTGYKPKIDVLKKAATEWGWNGDTLFEEIQQPMIPGQPGQEMPGQIDPSQLTPEMVNQLSGPELEAVHKQVVGK
jgi:hypothetical protein